jgi:hypothetical protein
MEATKMKIEKVKLYYVDHYKYLPSVTHTILLLEDVEATEEGHIIKIQKGTIKENNGILEFVNKDKSIKLSFIGSGRPIFVKVNNAWVDDIDGKVNLELEVVDNMPLRADKDSFKTKSDNKIY